MASETKRQNVGNKTPVALPNSPPTPPPTNTISLEAALSLAIGARIRISTVAPTANTIEGTLFTADPITNLIAINTAPSSSSSSSATSNTTTTKSLPAFLTGSYRILPVSQITTFTILSLQPPPSKDNTNITPTFTTAPLPISALPLAGLRAREAAAIRKLHEIEARRGPKGTTKEAQDIFDAIARTYPCRWLDKGGILVNDSVIIERPYNPDNCKAVGKGPAAASAGGGGSGAGAPSAGANTGAGLERIKKVLKMEREKLELRNAKFEGLKTVAPGGTKKGG